MDRLDIFLSGDKTVFAPREVIAGRLEWALETNPRLLELSLFWYTAGKGTRDVGVIDARRFENPGTLGAREFSFTLPDGPYSFSGKLISLIWALELTCTPRGVTTRREITVAPGGREVLLGSVRAQNKIPFPLPFGQERWDG